MIHPHIYSVAYKRVNSHLEVDDNSIHFTKFLLPNPRLSEYVLLRNEDIVESFELPIINATQDKCFYNGKLFILSGYSTP